MGKGWKKKLLGKYVIVRCRDAGVHAGVLVSMKKRGCVLRDARRLWRWYVPDEEPDFLSGVALRGLDHGPSKIGAVVPLIALTEACEIGLTTKKAQQSITEAPTWKRTK